MFEDTQRKGEREAEGREGVIKGGRERDLELEALSCQALRRCLLAVGGGGEEQGGMEVGVEGGGGRGELLRAV